MEHSGYVAEQDFQTARKNDPNYAVAGDFTALQGGSVYIQAFPNESFISAPLTFYRQIAVPFEASKENRPPRVPSEGRSKFKQRTFPGKPLPDEATIQAAQVGSEIEDDPIIRRLFGR